MMKNPWIGVASRDYNGSKIIVADDDWKYIKQFIERKSYPSKGDPNYALKLEVYPQHFVGDIQHASVIILSLNPGYDQFYENDYKSVPEYANKIKNNLELNSTNFHALEFSTISKLGYWGEKLQDWIIDKDSKDKNEILTSLKTITKNIALAEFFPYHSISYDDRCDKLAGKDYLPTQKFLFDIIKNRIKQNDVKIILTRSFKRWYEAIPELKNYENCFEVNNPNKPSLKPKNILKVTRVSVESEINTLLNELNKEVQTQEQ